MAPSALVSKNPSCHNEGPSSVKTTDATAVAAGTQAQGGLPHHNACNDNQHLVSNCRKADERDSQQTKIATYHNFKRLLNVLKHEDWREAARVLDQAMAVDIQASLEQVHNQMNRCESDVDQKSMKHLQMMHHSTTQPSVVSSAGGFHEGQSHPYYSNNFLTPASTTAGGFTSSTSLVERMLMASDSSGQIPLHIAIWKRAPDHLIFRLIDACEKTVMQKTNNKSTPLHFATFYASSAAVIEYLCIKYPLALDEVNEYGVTPRTYDLQKLSPKAKQLLQTPTKVWLEQFVTRSLEETTALRMAARTQMAVDQNLQTNLVKATRELSKLKTSHEQLTLDKEVLEHQIEDAKHQTTLLESLSNSIEKSLEESVRWGNAINAPASSTSSLFGSIATPVTNRRPMIPSNLLDRPPAAATPGRSSGTATPNEESEQENDDFDILSNGEAEGSFNDEYKGDANSSPLGGVSTITHSMSQQHMLGRSSQDNNMSTTLEVNRNLERRIAYLEDRLADALESLDTQILKRDTVVENGWVMTNTDPI